jgi:hypothetical protein
MQEKGIVAGDSNIGYACNRRSIHTRWPSILKKSSRVLLWQALSSEVSDMPVDAYQPHLRTTLE